MPLLVPEKVVSFVIADNKVLEHLRRSELHRSGVGFREFVSKFGIHDLGEVSESQLMALVAARNTLPLIDLLQIPSGKPRNERSGQAHYDIHTPKTSLTPGVTQFLSQSPSSDQEWEVLRDPDEIPQAVPEDLLLRRLAKREFLRRLTEGELLRSAWINVDLDESMLSQQEIQDKVSSPEYGSADEDARPYGFLLLDASESMGTGRDRRSEVARGIALAYLLSQFESGNPTVLYLFRHELSPVIGGESRRAFESAAAAVLSHSHEGMTNLQSALKLLSEAMGAVRKRVDIVLISDGVTRLTANPVVDSHLHTFLLGLRPEEFDTFSAEQYQDSLNQLRTWSDVMFRVDPDIMVDASVPRREDVLNFGKVLKNLDDEITSSATADKVRRIQNRLSNLKAMIARYRDFAAAPDRDVDDLWFATKEAIQKYGVADPQALAQQNVGGWTALDKDLSIALETKHIWSAVEIESLGSKWGAKSGEQFESDPIQNLLAVLKYFKRRLRSALRRLRSHLFNRVRNS